MPQFDFFTFSTQAFWLLLFFFNFYLVLLIIFVSKYSELLKFRGKLNALYAAKDTVATKRLGVVGFLQKALIH